MYEKRDKAAQSYLKEEFLDQPSFERPDYIIEEIRAAFKAGWAARKAAQYDVARINMYKKGFGE